MRVCNKKASLGFAQQQIGMTLVEVLVVLALLASLTAIALPSFKEFIINRRLENRAIAYVTHMNWARSLAVSRNQPVNLRISGGESASCYIIFHGPVNDCTCNAYGAVCNTPGNEQLVVVLPHSENIRVSARTESATTRINPTQGMISPTLTAIFTADNGKAIHNISNILGRTRSCSPERPNFGLKIC
ncbi:MAG: fimbrial assembly protein [Polaromonas sp.]|nr:fimbrial assembly protein [Polaromonas sp.]